MELRNRHDGTISGTTILMNWTNNQGRTQTCEYHSLKELERDWEDYKKDNRYWYITSKLDIEHDYANPMYSEVAQEIVADHKRVGNFFKTREDAERAKEKLQALRALRKQGFRPKNVDITSGLVEYRIKAEFILPKSIELKDAPTLLETLFAEAMED